MQIYGNTTYRFTEIHITVIEKFKIPNWRNTTCRSAEIQMAELQNYKWLLNYGWLLNNGGLWNYGWLLN